MEVEQVWKDYVENVGEAWFKQMENGEITEDEFNQIMSNLNELKYAYMDFYIWLKEEKNGL